MIADPRFYKTPLVLEGKGSTAKVTVGPDEKGWKKFCP